MALGSKRFISEMAASIYMCDSPLESLLLEASLSRA